MRCHELAIHPQVTVAKYTRLLTFLQSLIAIRIAKESVQVYDWQCRVHVRWECEGG